MQKKSRIWKRTVFEKNKRNRPHTIFLEITSRCNMRCPMCITHDHQLATSGSELTAEQIKALLTIGKRTGFDRLVITGGEPTLAKHLLETVQSAVDLGYVIFLSSNLLKLDHALFLELFRLLNDPKHTFQSSFDSIVKSEMNAIRGGHVYDKVVENFKAFRALKESTQSEVIFKAAIVVQDTNFNSVDKTVDFLLDDIEVDGVTIQARHDYSRVTPQNYRKQPFPDYPFDIKNQLLARVQSLFQRAVNEPRINMVGVSYENWVHYYNNPLDINDICRATSQLYIDAAGNFRGCLYSETIGNCLKTDLASFLKSEPYQDFKKFSEICKICMHGCS